MQDLLRRYPGVISTRVGYTRRRGAERHLSQSRKPCRGDRDHLRSREDQLPQAAGVLLPDPRSDDAEPPGQRPRRQLSFGDLLHQRRAEAGRRGHDRRRRCLRAVAGQGGDRGGAGRRRSGRPSPSTRTIWSAIPNGYTCHFIRPDWKLPHRAETRRVA